MKCSEQSRRHGQELMTNSSANDGAEAWYTRRGAGISGCHTCHSAGASQTSKCIGSALHRARAGAFGRNRYLGISSGLNVSNSSNEHKH